MIAEPKCYKRGCVHFQGVTRDKDTIEQNERVTCTAFPDRIPAEIAYGTNKHLDPLVGQDNNVVFQKEK